MAEIRLLRQQMDRQQQQHEAELKALQAQIDGLKETTASSGSSRPTPSAAPTTQAAEAELEGLISGTAGPAPSAAGQSQARPLNLQGTLQSFNPDISLNGDFLAAFSHGEGRGGQFDDKLLFREIEIVFMGAVDPYTTATVNATIGRKDNEEYKADLEEAFLSYRGLPWGLGATVGQFRSEFGKANPYHLHALPWTDYPLVIQRYFGKEGLAGAGAELSWLVPNPANKYILLTYEIINNDNGSLFAGSKSDDLAHILHLKSFFDLAPTSTLEIGGSFAEAPNDSGHGEKRSLVEGFDLTYRWKPKDAGLYRSFLWQNELLFAQADLKDGQESTWGGYSAADYQFAKQWKIGGRYDNTQLPFSSSLHERGFSVYLTFLQSEFVFWRLGYLYTDRNFLDQGNGDEQQLFLQLNWTLGAHPAHRY